MTDTVGLDLGPIFYGHACIKQFSSDGAAVIMDPWFSRNGAFFGSWFQFPENAHLLGEALNGVTDICVSHNHADHFDVQTLLHALKSDPSLILHIPKYNTTWFLKRSHHFLRDFKDRIIEHVPYEPFFVGADVSVFFVPEESPSEIDSAIICSAHGKKLINLNDSRLNSEQLFRIRDMIGEVDYLALQGSGASEYPITYTYPKEEMRLRSIKKRRDKLDHCKKLIDLLEPRRILFFAGPPVFLDEALARFNERQYTSVFPDQLDIVRHMEREYPAVAERALFLLPGEAFDNKYLWKLTDIGSKRLLPYTQKEDYIESYRGGRKDVCTVDWGEPLNEEELARYFDKMVKLSAYMSAKIAGEVTFIAKGRRSTQTVTVDFANRRVRKGMSSSPLLTLTVPAAAVQAVLDQTETWDDVLLSLRLVFDETTEHYIPHFKTLLRYMDSEVFHAVEQYEKQIVGLDAEIPMMQVKINGETFRIQRFCPHAGTDLEHHGRINEDGTITCLAHRLCFDINSGACINANGYRLRVESQTSEEEADVCIASNEP